MNEKKPYQSTEKERAQIILEALISGELPPETEVEILSWLAKYGEYPQYTEALLDVWKKYIVPDAQEAEADNESDLRFDRYKKALGFPQDYADEWEVIDRICNRVNDASRKKGLRMRLRRIAAIVIPCMLAAGAALILLTRRAEVAEKPVPELVAEIPVQIPAEQQPVVEIVVEEAPPVEVEEVVEAPVAEEPTVYDLVYSAPAGGARQLQLPDNSTVLMNDGSRISFSTEKREALLEGEAYFKVAKGQDKIFRVKTGHLTVNVTGTQFNVCGRDGKSTVVLVSGSVGVDFAGRTINMSPMHQLVCNHGSGTVEQSPSDGRGWWKEPVVFENATLYSILEWIEDHFDMHFPDKEHFKGNSTLYTISFDKMSAVDEVLEAISGWMTE
ncbi:FecR family protein [Alistipes sp. OttesenSCG-928-B03]|nr:FecR family protein [Alistipes sp. OttesenSCG-928-B03]